MAEERLRWFKQIIGKKLMVRDVEAFLQSTCNKLKSEESKMREDERDVLMQLMILKRNDERRNMRDLRREKERLRRYIQKEYGKRNCYDLIVKKLRREIRKRRIELREKYDKKISHLAEIRKKEIEERKRECIPKELGCFRKCVIFDKEKFSEIEKETQDVIKIGKIDLDEDEKSILLLHPNFAVLRYLDEKEHERDAELGLAKLRYGARSKREKEALKEYDMGEQRKRKIRKTDINKDTSNSQRKKMK